MINQLKKFSITLIISNLLCLKYFSLFQQTHLKQFLIFIQAIKYFQYFQYFESSKFIVY